MIDTAIKKGVSRNEHISYNDLLDVIIEHKTDIHKFINKRFGNLQSGIKELLLKRYGNVASLRDEIIQDVTLTMLEQIGRLKKEHIYHSLLNYLKYGVLQEVYKQSSKKEIYDFEVSRTKEGRVITFLETVIDDSALELQQKSERQEMYELLLIHLKDVELSDFQLKILDYKFFKDEDLTFKEIAKIFDKKESTVSEACSVMLRKIRAYYIINQDVTKILNPVKSISVSTDWNRDELEFIISNYKKMKRKEVLAFLNAGRDKKITENYLKNTARKLGATDSSLSDAGTYSVDDFINNVNKKSEFTKYEEKFIHKNWHTVNHVKILEVINFERDKKTTLNELEAKGFSLFNKKRKKYEHKN